MNKLFFVLLVLGMVSCGSKNLDTRSYALWVKDEGNGLHKIKKIGSITLELQYKPVEYLIAEELANGNLTKEALEKRKAELEGMQYFDLRLKDERNDQTQVGNLNQEELQDLLYYFSFRFQNDINLIEGEDTLQCILYHFERTYNLKNVRSFVIGFENKSNKKVEDKNLVIDSRVLGLGILKIKINKDDLESIPKLKM